LAEDIANIVLYALILLAIIAPRNNNAPEPIDAAF